MVWRRDSAAILGRLGRMWGDWDIDELSLVGWITASNGRRIRLHTRRRGGRIGSARRSLDRTIFACTINCDASDDRQDCGRVRRDAASDAQSGDYEHL